MSSACILIHYHEIAIKGGNRSWFERRMIQNVRKHLAELPHGKIALIGARIFVFDISEARWPEYSERLRCIMGMANATLMYETAPKLDALKERAVQVMGNRDFDTFRISARRQYKEFPYTSNQLNVAVGDHIGSLCRKPVKLKGADLDIVIEIVNNRAFVGAERLAGFGGLPVGVSETAVALLSSGIDSPVAAFEMIKRGVQPFYVHFHSVPSTSRQSMRNVEAILNVLVQYQLKCRLLHVPLLAIQQEIMAHAPNKLWVLLFRRSMVRLATMIAHQFNMPALISGESVGQVASQTLSNIRATGDATDLPILRPLCGENKDNIVQRAQAIGTYEISVEPYQDCCSFFVPPHPETKACLDDVKSAEAEIELADLEKAALADAEEFQTVFTGSGRPGIPEKGTRIKTDLLNLTS